MKLSQLNFDRRNIKRNLLLTCGYARTYDFDYTGKQVTDPRPNALALGRFKSPRRNQLMSGINLNYLSPEQIKRLRQNLPAILKDRNLRRRARKLRAMMPDVFNSAYRTYNRAEINDVDPGTLKFMKQDPEAQEPGITPDYNPPPEQRVKPTQQASQQEVPGEQPEAQEEPKPTPIRTPGSPARDLGDREIDRKIVEPEDQREDEAEKLSSKPESPEPPGRPERIGDLDNVDDEAEEPSGSADTEPDEEEI